MKVIINRCTAQIHFLSTPDFSSPHLVIFGRIDKLHTGGNAIWNPDHSQIESFLDQSEAELNL